MVINHAVSPVLSCSHAFIVREIAIGLKSYYSKKAKIEHILKESQSLTDIKKSAFNTFWTARYSGDSEFWTFEMIIETYKVRNFNIASYQRS